MQCVCYSSLMYLILLLRINGNDKRYNFDCKRYISIYRVKNVNEIFVWILTSMKTLEYSNRFCIYVRLRCFKTICEYFVDCHRYLFLNLFFFKIRHPYYLNTIKLNVSARKLFYEMWLKAFSFISFIYHTCCFKKR